MDDFDFEYESQDLSTSAFHLNFDGKGRITQLWLGDGAGALGMDLQFICPVLQIGDETTEEYLPGTILLGARTAPEEPWLVSRNTNAKVNSVPSGVEFEYEFSLLPEFEVTGKFYEHPEKPSVILWDIKIKNRSRQSIEIGELGFPFALNNILDGQQIGDEGMNTLLTERLVVHEYIGGASSFLSARRLCGDPPGVVVYPGKDSAWEFAHHVPMSLKNAAGWEGIPVVYIYSQATVEREDWGEWMYGNSSLVLEPKEERTFQMCFGLIAPKHQMDPVLALADYGNPVFRTSPGTVVPTDVTMYLETAGTRPAQFETNAEDCEIETESDEYGAISVLKKPTPGPVRVNIEDMDGRESWCDLLFIPPLKDLIQARAHWICQHQVVKEGVFRYGILMTDNVTMEPIQTSFQTPWGITSSLADALFLVEKNRIYPDYEQITVIDDYVEKFILKKFQKPGQGTFGVIAPDWEGGVAMDGSRAQVYVHAARLYLALAALAPISGLSRSPEEYVNLAEKTVQALIRFADREASIAQPLYGAGELHQFEVWRQWRHRFLEKYRLPFWSGRDFSTITFEEVSRMAELDCSISATGSVEQLLNTVKSPAPNWWSYGSEPRALTEHEGHPMLSDFGLSYPAFTSVASSRAMTTWVERDYIRLDENNVRLAFGGLLAPWSMVKEDGNASMGFTSDLGSKNYGLCPVTGDIGFALADYLRGATCFLLSNQDRGFISFGTHFDTYPKDGMTVFRLEPWDGVGRRVVVRHMNLIVSCEGAKIDLLEFDVNLQWLKLSLDTPNEAMDRKIVVEIDGLWGTHFTVEGAEQSLSEGKLVLSTHHEGTRLKEIEVKVIA